MLQVGLGQPQEYLQRGFPAEQARRRAPEETEEVLISAADPLNLVGIVLPGARVPAGSGATIAFRNGSVVEVGTLGSIRSRRANEGAAAKRVL